MKRMSRTFECSVPLKTAFLMWFYVGMHTKRWLLLMIAGGTFMSFGLTSVITETPEFLPRFVGPTYLAIVGTGAFAIGGWNLRASIAGAFRSGDDTSNPELPHPHSPERQDARWS